MMGLYKGESFWKYGHFGGIYLEIFEVYLLSSIPNFMIGEWSELVGANRTPCHTSQKRFFWLDGVIGTGWDVHPKSCLVEGFPCFFQQSTDQFGLYIYIYKITVNQEICTRMVPFHSLQRVYPERWKAPNRVRPLLCSCSLWSHTVCRSSCSMRRR